MKAILAELRKQEPQAKVLLLSIFPRAGKPRKDLKDPETAVAADELHLSSEGYKIWADAIEGKVGDLLAK